jgi:Skp family chaperone for outer membrane proteins
MGKNKFQVPSMSIQGENVIGMINANGSARVNVDQKVIHQATPEMEKLFKRIHKEIKVRPDDPKVDKDKLESQVKKIEAETAKGASADKAKLERWMKTLAKMAPDILEVMAASLAGPVAGFTVVFKKIVERTKAISAEP